MAFNEFHRGQEKISSVSCDITDTDTLDELIGEYQRKELVDQIELLDGASFDFDIEKVKNGTLTPVFFGSALTNFGVEPFLDYFIDLAAPPLERKSKEGKIEPDSEDFSAFVFKIQANMNKAHRDRMTFMRICSGKFERDKEYYHIQGKRSLRLSQPTQLMASDRQVINEAYAGDIIGVFDPGIFSIGDTVCETKHKVEFEGIPTFAPEHFAVIEHRDSLKRKQFVKGVEQIAQEGAIQIFHEPDSGMERVIVGVVGVLQFEVLEYRLKNEYNVDVIRNNLPFSFIRWIKEKNCEVKDLNLTSDTKWVQDFKGNDLLIFTSDWNIKWALDKNEGLVLEDFSKE